MAEVIAGAGATATTSGAGAPWAIPLILHGIDQVVAGGIIPFLVQRRAFLRSHGVRDYSDGRKAGMSAAWLTIAGGAIEGGLLAYAAYDDGKPAVEVKADLDAGRLDAAASKVGGLTGTIIGGVGASAPMLP